MESCINEAYRLIMYIKKEIDVEANIVKITKLIMIEAEIKCKTGMRQLSLPVSAKKEYMR